MEYYYTPQENIFSDKLEITGDEAKHLSKVLRKSVGEEIYVTDGKYNLFKTRIDSVSVKNIVCNIIEKIEGSEPGIKIYLYQSLLRNTSRFEFAIEKCTEIGVFEITPVVSEHVINKTASRTERWQSIALSAMKQSQRTYLPAVNNSVLFNQAVNDDILGNTLKLIAHEQQTKNSIYIKDIGNLNKYDSIRIFIGPEGGFSRYEVDLAVEKGFKVLNIGNRKYRSETAAVLVCGYLLL
jgi:16S rRNA (uracil1498-N3)-methyltransferase